MKIKKINKNVIQCKLCKDILVSEHTHDFKTCSCGEVSIDGGKEYLRRSAKHLDNIIELSDYEVEND